MSENSQTGADVETDADVEDVGSDGEGVAGLDRRGLIARGAIGAGAAFVAPTVLGSVFSPAAAATDGGGATTPTDPTIPEPDPEPEPDIEPNTVIVDTANGLDSGPVVIPSDRQVRFEIIGGGGGGGGFFSYVGGVGTKVTGTLAGAPLYTLDYQVGEGGGGGKTSYTSNGGVDRAGSGGSGGDGLAPGGAGGDNGGVNDSNGQDGSGAGGGGGGASAIWVGTRTLPSTFVITVPLRAARTAFRPHKHLWPARDRKITHLCA